MYINGWISLAEFRIWFASMAIEAGNCNEPRTMALADDIIGQLSDLDEKYIGTQEFRLHLIGLLELAQQNGGYAAFSPDLRISATGLKKSELPAQGTTLSLAYAL